MENDMIIRVEMKQLLSAHAPDSSLTPASLHSKLVLARTSPHVVIPL